MSVNIQVCLVITEVTQFCTENSRSVSIGGSTTKGLSPVPNRFNTLYTFSFLERQYQSKILCPHMLFLHWFFTQAIIASHAAHARTTEFVTETRSQNHTPIFKVRSTTLTSTHTNASVLFLTPRSIRKQHMYSCTQKQKRYSVRKATFRDLFFIATQTGTLNTLCSPCTYRYASNENIQCTVIVFLLLFQVSSRK